MPFDPAFVRYAVQRLKLLCPTMGKVKIAQAAAAPKYIVCDKGKQFWCNGFKKWCRRKNIRPRFGAVGKNGSIAVIERFIRTMKAEALRRILLPLRQPDMRRELRLFADWYNKHRPHSTLDGRTPDEVYFRRFSASRKPRLEPRPLWPRGSPCAKPWALLKGRPGAHFELHITYHEGRQHLPIVKLQRVA